MNNSVTRPLCLVKSHTLDVAARREHSLFTSKLMFKCQHRQWMALRPVGQIESVARTLRSLMWTFLGASGTSISWHHSVEYSHHLRTGLIKSLTFLCPVFKRDRHSIKGVHFMRFRAFSVWISSKHSKAGPLCLVCHLKTGLFRFLDSYFRKILNLNLVNFIF